MIERMKKRKREFEEELDGVQKKIFRATVFLLKFSILSLPVYIIASSGWNPIGLREFFASVSGSFLEILGLDISVEGFIISSKDLLLDVSTDSTGWKSVLAFSALVLSTRTKKMSKFKGIIVGTFIIVVANTLRIVSMVYLVNRFGISYELLHTIMWRWGLTLVVLLTWILWFKNQRPS